MFQEPVAQPLLGFRIAEERSEQKLTDKQADIETDSKCCKLDPKNGPPNLKTMEKSHPT